MAETNKYLITKDNLNDLLSSLKTKILNGLNKKEDAANKSNTLVTASTETKFPTVKAVNDALDTKETTNNLTSKLKVSTLVDATGSTTIEIQGFKDSVTAAEKAKIKILSLPETIGGYPVTRIAASSFAGLTAIEQINLPKTLIYIGAQAFNNCTGITGVVTIPDSVTTIDNGAFSGCSHIEKIILSKNLSSLSATVFQSCSALTEVINITSKLTTIGASAFYNCESLKAFNFTNTITSIGASAFYNCESLTKVDLTDNSLTSIGSQAFYGCDGLEELILNSDSTVTVSYDVFNHCDNLKYITILDSSLRFKNGSTVSTSVFQNCPNIKYINFVDTQISTSWQNYFSTIFASKPDIIINFEYSYTDPITTRDLGTAFISNTNIVNSSYSAAFGRNNTVGSKSFEIVGITAINTTESTPWDGTMAANYARGSGTSSNPYIIETSAQLAKLVNDASTTNKYYKLAKNLILNEVETGYTNQWYFISDAASSTAVSFNGNFDGDGYSIAGLYFDDTEVSGFSNQSCTGLFPKLGPNAVIRNLGLYAPFLYASVAGFVGGFAGVCSGSTTTGVSKIENCFIDSDDLAITGFASTTGGFIGKINNTFTITNSYFAGLVEDYEEEELSNGIIGNVVAGNLILNQIYSTQYICTYQDSFSKIVCNNAYYTDMPQSAGAVGTYVAYKDLISKPQTVLTNFDFTNTWVSNSITKEIPSLQIFSVKQNNTLLEVELSDMPGNSTGSLKYATLFANVTVADLVSLQLAKNFDFCATITSKAIKTVTSSGVSHDHCLINLSTLDRLDRQLLIDSFNTPTTFSKTLYIPKKPSAGRIIQGNTALVSGTANTSCQESNYIAGETNIASGKNNLVSGSANKAGSNNLISGQNNTSKNSNNIIAGSNNTTRGENNLLIGKNLTSVTDNSITIGQYNAIGTGVEFDDVTDLESIVTIGNGSLGNLHNAVEIYPNGAILSYISADEAAVELPDHPRLLTTKGYVDDCINSTLYEISERLNDIV